MTDRLQMLLVVSLLSVVLLAGCTLESKEGHLNAVEVNDVPDDAVVVPASDDRIADVEPIQEVLERAAALDGELATVTVEGLGSNQVFDTLMDLPGYSEDEGYRSGHYIRYQEQVIVVNAAVRD